MTGDRNVFTLEFIWKLEPRSAGRQEDLCSQQGVLHTTDGLCFSLTLPFCHANPYCHPTKTGFWPQDLCIPPSTHFITISLPHSLLVQSQPSTLCQAELEEINGGGAKRRRARAQEAPGTREEGAALRLGRHPHTTHHHPAKPSTDPPH